MNPCNACLPRLDQCAGMQQGVPVYVFRLASLAGPLQKELNAIPEDRRYKRMCVLPSPVPFLISRRPSHFSQTVSRSTSSCSTSASPSVPPYLALLPPLRHHRVRPRPRPPNHTHRHPSRRRCRLWTSSASPLA